MIVDAVEKESWPLKKVIRLILGVFVAVFFIYLSFKNISWKSLLELFESSHIEWIGYGILCFIIGHGFRVYRWSLMLTMSLKKEISFGKCYGPYVSSFALNNVLPFRAGDVIRLFAFNRELGATTGTIAATLFIERLLDLLMILIALLIALFIFDINVGALFDVGILAIVGLVSAIFLVVLFPSNAVKPVLMLISLFERLQISKIEKVTQEVIKLTASLKSLGGAWNSGQLIFLSVLAWLFEALVFVCAAKSLPSIEFPSASLLAMPAGTLSTAIPAAPGYVGTFHYFAKQSMIICGNSDTASLAYSILTHAMLWLPITIAGGIYLTFKKKGKH